MQASQLSALDFAHAAEARTSRRAYDGTPVQPAELDRLESFCADFRPSPSARVVLLRRAPDDIYRSIVGSYGRITGAPSAFAMVGRLQAPDAHEAVGYTGEAAVLEATRRGLGTCWVGGLFAPERVADLVGLGSDETVWAVCAVGNPATTPSAYERTLKAFKRSERPRKPADQIAPGLESWPEWMRRGVRLASIAPSAVNRQPWRFSRQGETVTISFRGREAQHSVPKRLDCGIAMLHFEIGARTAGVSGVWECGLDSPDVARYAPA